MFRSFVAIGTMSKSFGITFDCDPVCICELNTNSAYHYLWGLGTLSNVPTYRVVNVVNHYNEVHVDPLLNCYLLLVLQVHVQDVQVAIHIVGHFIYFEFPCSTWN
jgi:hypothetical protein